MKLYTKKTLPPSSTITHEDNLSKSSTEINVSTKSRAFDKSFFSNRAQLPKIKGKYAGEFSRVKLYSIHCKLNDDGKLNDEGVSPSVLITSAKKHHKKGKKNAKNRGANGYDI